MNYFELYQIPIGFKVDAKALKRKFYALSKEFHPDFHADKSEEEQVRILEMSTMNNEAYKVLKDFDKRMKYVLDLKNLLEEGKDKLPQDFLMEMMDINEALMELEFDFDKNKIEAAKTTINNLKQALYKPIQEVVEHYDDKESSSEELSLIKKYYLKHRYILRIQNNLNKFASAS